MMLGLVAEHGQVLLAAFPQESLNDRASHLSALFTHGVEFGFDKPMG